LPPAFAGIVIQYFGDSSFQDGLHARLLGPMAGSKLGEETIFGAWRLEIALFLACQSM
jgi:hypothetical protein